MRVASLVLGLFLTMVLLLGACSSPAPSPTSTPAPTSSPTATTPPKPTTASPTATKPSTTTPVASVDPNYYPKMIPNVKMPDTMILLGGGAADSGYTLFAKAYQAGLRQDFPNIGTRVELSTSAKSANRVNSNDAFLGFTIPSAALDAWKGNPPQFTTALTNFRNMGLAPSGNALLPIVLKNSPITDLSQLKGKRVFVGQVGSTCEIYVDYLLKAAYGYGYKDIEAAGGVVFRGSYTDASNGLLEGKLDIAFYFLTMPQADVMQVASSPKGMRIIDWPDSALEKLWAEPWGESRGFVSKSALPGMTKDYTQTTTSAFMTIVNKDQPDDVVYNTLVATYKNNGQNFKDMQALMATLEYIKIGTLVGKEFPMPYHPGAKKFWWDLWQKRGLLK